MIYGVVTKLLCAQHGWCVWETCEMTANKIQNEENLCVANEKMT
jgi:hypothetical protein